MAKRDNEKTEGSLLSGAAKKFGSAIGRIKTKLGLGSDSQAAAKSPPQPSARPAAKSTSAENKPATAKSKAKTAKRASKKKKR